MIVWSVVLPIIGTIALLVLLGVGIARSRGLREVLLGIRGKGKVSLLNLLSVEGAGLVLILAIFVGGGIVYPLARATDAARLERLERVVDRLRAQNRNLRETVAGRWQIDAKIEVPGVPQEVLKNQFLRVSFTPALVDYAPPSGSTVRFTIPIPVKLGADGEPVPNARWLHVEYGGYETFTYEIPETAFKERMIPIAGALKRHAPASAPAEDVHAPETWEKPK